MDAKKTPSTQDALILSLLAVVTISAVGLLLPDPINSGSVLAWLQVPIPLILAGGMGRLAYQAHQRGEYSTARAVLGSAIAAVAFIAFVGSRPGG